MFNQHWELEYQPLGPWDQDKVTTKVTFTADVKSEVNRTTPEAMRPPAAFFKEKVFLRLNYATATLIILKSF
jgi:hypothetical protein